MSTAAEDGLAAAETIAYDALILDLSLPDMDGIEVLKSLRKAPGPARPC